MFDKKIIRKHVSIIHAYSNMTSLQRKIVNGLLYEFNTFKADTISNSVSFEHSMSLSRLSKLINFNSKNSKYLKESIDELASIKIEWNILKDKVPLNISFLNLRVLHGSPTFYHDGMFNFSFHKVFVNLASDSSIYGTIDIDLQSKFGSKYSHSLYENSTRFLNLKKCKVIELDLFRKLLGVHENKYSTIRELTRNVINPSIEEVNDRADFVVKLTPIRAGKKLLKFELAVSKKKSYSHCLSTVNKHSENSAIDELITRYFGENHIHAIRNKLNKYSEKYICEKVNYTIKRAKKEANGLYPIRYLMSALIGDYKETIESNTEVKKDDFEHTEWAFKLRELQSIIDTGKRWLISAEKSQNEVMITQAKSYLNKAKNELDIHYKKKNVGNSDDNNGASNEVSSI